MAIESAKDFIALVDSGKYLNGVNAKRGAGRTRLSAAEKEKVFAYIDSVFPPEDGEAAAKPAKKVAAKKFTRMAKVTKKKVTRKIRAATEEEATEADEAEAEAAPAAEEEAPPAPTPAKGLKGKKALAKKTATSLAISPSEVKTVADFLQLVDSTVQSSVSVINALRAAHEISSKGSIDSAIDKIKQTLEGAANMLHNNVVAPLSNTTNQPDPAVAARLEQVVTASANGLAYHTQEGPHPSMMATTTLPGT